MVSTLRPTVPDIICRVMMEGGTDTEPTSDEKSGVSMSDAGRALDLVKDVLESLIGKVVQTCEDRKKSKRGKVAFSEQQRMRLEQAFSESRYLGGGSKDMLAAQLGMGSKQVEAWFHHRRRAEAKAAALRAEEARRAATTWPHYKLGNAKQVQEVSVVKEVKKVSSHSGKGLLKELEENMKEVEMRAMDTVAIRPTPLLSVTLTEQEVMYREYSLFVNCWISRCCIVRTVSIEKVGTWDLKLLFY